MGFSEESEYFSFWLAIYACQLLMLLFYHGSNRDGLGQWKPGSSQQMRPVFELLQDGNGSDCSIAFILQYGTDRKFHICCGI